jgi:uncharacterized radical SAM protein YgiQ
VEKLIALPDFKGFVTDVGGATANMHGIQCFKRQREGPCRNKKCVFPQICNHLRPDHRGQINILRNLRKIKGIKKVFIASGIRYDLLLHDKENGHDYLREIIQHHTSGQLKVAPEHASSNVLKLMAKPSIKPLLTFRDHFVKISKVSGKEQFLTYYFIAAHPGCNEENMYELKTFLKRELKATPRQVQIFTPLPSTYSSLMYFTEIDPTTGEKIFVEKRMGRKQRQKDIIVKRSI